MIGNDPEIIKTNEKGIINILKAAVEENYFQFDQQYYKQTGCFYIRYISRSIHQYMEHKQIYPILMKHQIIGYFI
jgi:hypothetical protein